MKKITFVFLFTFLLASFSSVGQVFWTETFGASGINCAGQNTLINGFVTSNGTWTMTNTGTNSAKANTWYVSSTEAGMGAGNCGDGCLNTNTLTNRTLHVGNISTSTFAFIFCPTGDCGAAYDASTNAEITDKRAESPVISCASKSNITLGFSYMEGGQNTLDDATIYYYDGTSWSLLSNTAKSVNTGCLGQGRWTAYTVALPASANNNTNVKIGFRWVNNGDGSGSDPSFAVDDITLSVVAAAPVANFTASKTSLCEGDCIAFTDQSTNAPTTWSWLFPGATPATSTLQSPNSVCYLTAGTYSVTLTATNVNGSSTTSKTTYIIVNPSATLALASVNATCGASNGAASVTATVGNSPYTYSWNNGQASANATGLSAGTYTVTVTTTNGCTKTSTVTVNAAGGPNVALTSSTNPLCNGASNGTATMSSSGGTGPYTYSWSNGQTTATASGLGAGVFTFTVTDAGGCITIQTVNIAQPAAVGVVTSNTSTGCLSATGTASASATGGAGSFTYAWSNGQSTQSINGLSAGTYSLTVTDANGCTSTSSTTVGQSGGPSANAGTNTTILQGASTLLNGSGGGAYSWSPATGLSCTNCANPIASPTITTTYTLIVTDINGCTAMATVTVTVEIPCVSNIFVPNVFSPNGDGKNDVLMVRGDCFRFYQFIIFDRWGEKVFETSDPLQGWDGTLGGKEFTTAVFIYQLNATLLDDKLINMKGNITLVK